MTHSTSGRTHPSSSAGTTPDEYAVKRPDDPACQPELAAACAADWNTVNEKIGSFANDHSTL